MNAIDLRSSGIGIGILSPLASIASTLLVVVDRSVVSRKYLLSWIKGVAAPFLSGEKYTLILEQNLRLEINGLIRLILCNMKSVM